MLEAEGWVGFGRVVTEVRVTVLPFIVGGGWDPWLSGSNPRR